MSYTINIPTVGQSLGNSRPQVLGNFNYINTTLKVNHLFNEANAGKHYKVEMPRQSPSPTPAADEGLLFTKLSGGITRLVWKRDASATDIELTGIDPLAASSGYSTLPGGLIIQWGVTPGNVVSGTNVNFPTTFPTTVYYINAIQVNAASAAAQRCVSVIPNGLDKFVTRITTLGSSPVDSSCQIYFLAIGN